MRQCALLSISFLLWSLSPERLLGQSLPKIQLGTIASLTYKESGDQKSPLQINDGDPTFLNKWALLMAAGISESVSLYAEVETVNGLSFVNYGLSAMYRPSQQDYLNFELGKFLVPFGTFLGRRWASENSFIDFPLIYEYRTALSAFEVPRAGAELLTVRGQGHSFQYHGEASTTLQKVSNSTSDYIPLRGSGLRVISREVYLTGVQLFGSFGKLAYHFGATNGSLSNPADINNTGGVNLLARVKYRPSIGLTLGTSLSSGTYLDKTALEIPLQEIGKSVSDFRQTTVGVDLGYSIGHIVFFSELVLNRWQTPYVAENLDVLASYLEGRYAFLTRFYLAVRFSSIDFAEIEDPTDVDRDGRLKEPWDYDVRQFELSLGYHINRNAILKIAAQFNRTLGTQIGDPSDDLIAIQSVVFF